MRPILLTAVILGFSCVAHAEGDEARDPRISLALSTQEKAQFLAEMRRMLVSIQGIVQGVGAEDRGLIIDSARASGNRMARATPDAVRNKLPREFKEIGAPTHMLFEELVVRAETDDMQTLMTFTGTLMDQCVKCHALFKVD
ncbi:hypothetical protein [Thiocystis violacea]|uniref:hypothetical protein n=1 Tax=Thiocystis violacea TaxID=13725 RepID=UPI0019036726|nr:hypothetical protein [Thiocystis violacea]MBK1724917.1 hypothetical protein [Thiocystis violacea]